MMDLNRRLVVLILFSIFISFEVTAQLEITQGDIISCPLHHIYDTRGLIKEYSSKGNNDQFNLRINSDDQVVFDVKYSGFSDEARTAFDAAIQIWSEVLKSDVPIKVFAEWAVADNIHNLGYVRPTEVINFPNAPSKNVIYPITLAEKIAKQHINGTAEADIVAVFNSGREDWYFGLDGNTPANQIDLLTVILHELGHGLGISGTFYKSGTSGSYGAGSGNPKIYDLFVYNGKEDQLISTFESGSVELGDQLTGNSLVFRSEIARQLSGVNSFPKLYAPNPFNPGSSISHLDESTYNGTINAMMTPFQGYGNANAQIGPLVTGMLYEMGWLYAYFTHDEIKDIEGLSNKKFEIELDRDSVNINDIVEVIYRYNDQEYTLPLSSDNNTNFSISLPQDIPFGSEVEYFFNYKDVFGTLFRYPSNPLEYFKFYYGDDTKSPSIVHTPVEIVYPYQEELVIQAQVTDNLGLESVILRYFIDDGEIFEKVMVLQSDNIFVATIDISEINLFEVSTFNYIIEATDQAQSTNISQTNNNEFYKIPVKSYPQVTDYTTDFSMGSDEFYGGLTVLKPTGFSNQAAHTNHPYLNDTVLYYQLLNPVLITETSSFLNFSEVLLVESPNDDSQNFLDYVEVQGSNDGGITWASLSGKYDSRLHSSWQDYFNGKLDGEGSNSIGTLNYFYPHSINLRESFSLQEQILIRFKFSSDSAFNGWGWAIDDIVISGNPVLGIFIEVNPIRYYPNPTSGLLWIDGLTENSIVYFNDITGKQFYPVIHGNDNENNFVDLSDFPSGLYTMTLVDRKKMIRSKIYVR